MGFARIIGPWQDLVVAFEILLSFWTSVLGLPADVVPRIACEYDIAQRRRLTLL